MNTTFEKEDDEDEEKENEIIAPLPVLQIEESSDFPTGQTPAVLTNTPSFHTPADGDETLKALPGSTVDQVLETIAALLQEVNKSVLFALQMVISIFRFS